MLTGPMMRVRYLVGGGPGDGNLKRLVAFPEQIRQKNGKILAKLCRNDVM